METFFNRLNTKNREKCIKAMLCKTAGVKKGCFVTIKKPLCVRHSVYKA